MILRTALVPAALFMISAAPAAAEIVSIKSEAGFGSGLAVRHNERCYVLTPSHVAGGRIDRIGGAGRASAQGVLIKDFNAADQKGASAMSVDLAVVEVPFTAGFACSEALPSQQEVIDSLQSADTVFVKRLSPSSGLVTSRYFIASTGTEDLELKSMNSGQNVVKGDSGSIVYQGKTPVAMILSTSGDGNVTALRFDVIAKLLENYLVAMQGNRKIAKIVAFKIDYNPIRVLNNPFYKLGEVDGPTMTAQNGVLESQLVEQISKLRLFDAVYAPDDKGAYASQVFSTSVWIAPDNSLSVAQCSYLPQGAKEVQVQALNNNGECPAQWTRTINIGYAFKIEVTLSDRLLGQDFVQKDSFSQAVNYNFQSVVGTVNTIIATKVCILAKQALQQDGHPKLKINRGDSLAGMLITLPVNILGAMVRSQNATSNKSLC